MQNDIVDGGGYILFFRHTERKKWIDVTAYDAYELLMPFNDNEVGSLQEIDLPLKSFGYRLAYFIMALFIPNLEVVTTLQLS